MRKTNKIVISAMIAATYTVISLIFAPFAYGPIQVRFSEALTLLPIFSPNAIIGVTAGCLITNMIGSSPIDMVFGTLATLIAAVLTYKLRDIKTFNLPLMATIPPIVVNAIIVGSEITYFFSDIRTIPVLIMNIITVGIGQIISCGVIGIVLVKFIQANPKIKEIVSK